jgi:hypothetical protein
MFFALQYLGEKESEITIFVLRFRHEINRAKKEIVKDKRRRFFDMKNTTALTVS